MCFLILMLSEDGKMKFLNSLIEKGWSASLLASLVMFVPLALNLDTSGFLPIWAFWYLGMFFTAMFFVFLGARFIEAWYKRDATPPSHA